MTNVVAASTNWVAVAAVIGSSLVGIAGVAFGYFNSKGERRHAEALAGQAQQSARSLAHDSWIYDDLKAAYVDLLTYVAVLRDAVDRTEPFITPKPDPPPVPNEEAARAGVGASGCGRLGGRRRSPRRGRGDHPQVLDRRPTSQGAPSARRRYRRRDRSVKQEPRSAPREDPPDRATRAHLTSHVNCAHSDGLEN
jgi:hypothetical protein